MKRPLSSLSIAYIILFTRLLVGSQVQAFVPLYAESMGATLGEIGLFLALRGVITLVLSTPSGIASDKVGRKKMMIIGSILQTLGCFLSSFANEPLHLYLTLFLNSFGNVLFHPAMSAYIGDVAGDRMGVAYSFFTTLYQITGTIGSIAGGYISDVFGLRTTFLSSSAYAFLTFIIVVTMLKDTSSATPKPGDKPKVGFFEGFRKLATNPLVWTCWSSVSTIHAAWGSITMVLPLYFGNLGISYTLIGFLFAANRAFNAMTRFAITLVSNKIKRFGFFLLMVIGLVVQALAISLFHTSTDFSALLVIMGLCGLGHGLCVPGVWAVLGMVTDKDSRGSAFGILTTADSSLQSLGRVLSGNLVEMYGYATSFTMGSLLSGAGAAIALVLFVIRRRLPDR